MRKTQEIVSEVVSDPYLQERLAEHVDWLRGKTRSELKELAQKFEIEWKEDVYLPQEEFFRQLAIAVTTNQLLREEIYIYADEQPLMGWRDIPGEGPWKYGWFQGGDEKAGTIRLQPVDDDEPIDIPYSLNLDLRVCRHPKLERDVVPDLADFEEEARPKKYKAVKKRSVKKRPRRKKPEVSYAERMLSKSDFERLRDEAHAVFLKSIEGFVPSASSAPESLPYLEPNCPTPEEVAQDPALRKMREVGGKVPKVHQSAYLTEKDRKTPMVRWSGDLTEKDLKRLTYAFPEGEPLIPLMLGMPPGYSPPTEYEKEHFGLRTGLEGTLDNSSDVTEEWLLQAGAWQHYITEHPAFKPMRDFLVSQGIQEEDVSSCYRRYLQAVTLIPDGEPVSSRVSDLLPQGIAHVEPKYFLMLKDAMSPYLGGDYAPILRGLAGCIRDVKALEKELASWNLTDEELYLLGGWFSEEPIMVRREALPRFVAICKSIEKHTVIDDLDGVGETSFTREDYWFGARSLFRDKQDPEWRVFSCANFSRYAFEQEASKRKLSLAEISHLVNHIDLSGLAKEKARERIADGIYEESDIDLLMQGFSSVEKAHLKAAVCVRLAYISHILRYPMQEDLPGGMENLFQETLLDEEVVAVASHDFEGVALRLMENLEFSELFEYREKRLFERFFPLPLEGKDAKWVSNLFPRLFFDVDVEIDDLERRHPGFRQRAQRLADNMGVELWQLGSFVFGPAGDISLSFLEKLYVKDISQQKGYPPGYFPYVRVFEVEGITYNWRIRDQAVVSDWSFSLPYLDNEELCRRHAWWHYYNIGAGATKPVTKAAQATGSAVLTGAQLAGAQRLNELVSQAVRRALVELGADESTLRSQTVDSVVKLVGPVVLHFICDRFGEAVPGSSVLKRGSELAMQATTFEVVLKVLSHFDFSEIQQQAQYAALEAPKRDLVEETMQVECEKVFEPQPE